ncbi:MAG: hypothetical protein IPK07_06395 [Deltaproteobacteria bacterium]|jgi:hypothetical protein|nr:hypothetical protein [Deltaproteobacteria bacterium]
MIHKATLLTTGTVPGLLAVMPLLGMVAHKIADAIHELANPEPPSATEIREMGAWFEAVSRTGSMPFSPLG